MNPRRLLADVRSLGWTAPLRAGYEVSKKTGLHGLVFERLVPPRGPVPPLISPFGVPSEVPGAAAERTLREAADIVDGRVRVFGESLDVGRSPGWHRVIGQAGEWPRAPWWKIDIRSEARRGDVKWAWELGRHRHLVVLARAVHLAPDDARYRATLVTHLESWLEHNPPESGVHWYSNLEIALRAVNWLQVITLAGPTLGAPLREAMARHLYHSARHLVADLPYTLSAMRNNHLLGDGLGLVALGKAFPDDQRASRWQKLGDRLFLGQLARHFRDDGSTIEDSISYHRFVLDMLAIRVLLGGAPAAVLQALVSGGQFLARLGALDGPVPQYGDWDEGRFLVSSGSLEDMVGIVRLAASLGGSGASPAWRAEHDEAAWHAPTGVALELEPAEELGRPIGGGFARAASGPITVWLKAGAAASHGHADLSNIVIRHRDSWVVGDPGTGAYNGSLDIRNYFRSSVAHAVVRLDNEDQLVPDRAFRWVHRADGRVGAPVELAGAVIMWGVHDAYRRLDGAPRVARAVILGPAGVTVADWVEGPARPYHLSVPLPPDVAWQDSKILLADGTELAVDLPGTPSVSNGGQDPFDGWWSETYGKSVPATRIEVHGTTESPIVWTVRRPDHQRATPEGAAVLVADGLSISVAFSEAGAQLLVVSPQGAVTRNLEKA